MPDVSKFNIAGKTINVKDAYARQQIANWKNNLSSVLDLKKRKMVIIGDSYATGHGITENTWSKQLQNACANGTVVNAYGGAGFTPQDNTFYSLLNNVSVSDPDSITDVVCCGGYNDKESTSGTIQIAIATFCQLAKTKFPNAMIHIGCMGWSCNTSDARKISNIVWDAYAMGASANGARPLTGLETVLHAYTNFSDDGFHPSQIGQNILAYTMKAYMLYGTIDRTIGEVRVAYSIRDGSSLKGTVNLIESMKNGMGTICSEGMSFNYTSGVTIGAHTTTVLAIAPRNAGCVMATASTAYGTVPIGVSFNGATEEFALLVFQRGSFGTISNGKAILLYPFTQHTGVTSLTIRPWRLTIPAGDC